MSFWLKLGLSGALFVAVMVWHILVKENAVQTALKAQRVHYESEVQKQVLKATETSNTLLEKALESERNKNEELKAINDKYAALSRSLQQRPSREDSAKDASSPSSCTGAELLREDGEFLAGEASRADRILKERNYYYEQYERAREVLSSH